jgi:hypothetical protein
MKRRSVSAIVSFALRCCAVCGRSRAFMDAECDDGGRVEAATVAMDAECDDSGRVEAATVAMDAECDEGGR